jgi:hypothetical protein
VILPYKEVNIDIEGYDDSVSGSDLTRHASLLGRRKGPIGGIPRLVLRFYNLATKRDPETRDDPINHKWIDIPALTTIPTETTRTLNLDRSTYELSKEIHHYKLLKTDYEIPSATYEEEYSLTNPLLYEREPLATFLFDSDFSSPLQIQKPDDPQFIWDGLGVMRPLFHVELMDENEISTEIVKYKKTDSNLIYRGTNPDICVNEQDYDYDPDSEFTSIEEGPDTTIEADDEHTMTFIFDNVRRRELHLSVQEYGSNSSLVTNFLSDANVPTSIEEILEGIFYNKFDTYLCKERQTDQDETIEAQYKLTKVPKFEPENETDIVTDPILTFQSTGIKQVDVFMMPRRWFYWARFWSPDEIPEEDFGLKAVRYKYTTGTELESIYHIGDAVQHEVYFPRCEREGTAEFYTTALALWMPPPRDFWMPRRPGTTTQNTEIPAFYNHYITGEYDGVGTYRCPYQEDNHLYNPSMVYPELEYAYCNFVTPNNKNLTLQQGTADNEDTRGLPNFLGDVCDLGYGKGASTSIYLYNCIGAPYYAEDPMGDANIAKCDLVLSLAKDGLPYAGYVGGKYPSGTLTNPSAEPPVGFPPRPFNRYIPWRKTPEGMVPFHNTWHWFNNQRGNLLGVHNGHDNSDYYESPHLVFCTPDGGPWEWPLDEYAHKEECIEFTPDEEPRLIIDKGLGENDIDHYIVLKKEVNAYDGKDNRGISLYEEEDVLNYLKIWNKITDSEVYKTVEPDINQGEYAADNVPYGVAVAGAKVGTLVAIIRDREDDSTYYVWKDGKDEELFVNFQRSAPQGKETPRTEPDLSLYKDFELNQLPLGVWSNLSIGVVDEYGFLVEVHPQNSLRLYGCSELWNPETQTGMLGVALDLVNADRNPGSNPIFRMQALPGLSRLIVSIGIPEITWDERSHTDFWRTITEDPLLKHPWLAYSNYYDELNRFKNWEQPIVEFETIYEMETPAYLIAFREKAIQDTGIGAARWGGTFNARVRTQWDVLDYDRDDPDTKPRYKHYYGDLPVVTALCRDRDTCQE